MHDVTCDKLPDPPGPTVDYGSTWRGPSYGSWDVQRLLDVDGELYVELRYSSGSIWDENPERKLVPALELLRDWRKQGHEYPQTVTCIQCDAQQTGTESLLEREGWWMYGMGSGPLCPAHNARS